MATVFLHRLARLPNAWLLFSLIVLVLVYPFLQPYAGGLFGCGVLLTFVS